jgi:hypothetical protein
MERLFSPCTRLYDLLETQGRLEEFRDHRELKLDVSTEEPLSAERAFTYANLYAMLEEGETVVWLAPTAFIMRGNGRGVHYWGQLNSCRFCFNVDGKIIHVAACSSEELLEIVDVVLRLLAASVVHSVILESWHGAGLINAPALAYLMEQCQSLKALTLKNVSALEEDQIRVLGTYSRPGLDIELKYCRIAGAAAAVYWLRSLDAIRARPSWIYVKLTFFFLAGFRGNNRLKSFRPRLSHNLGVSNHEVLAIAGALKENKGLVELELRHDLTMSDETWGAVCDYLKTHPTLQVLNLQGIRALGGAPFSQAVLKSRIQALVDMLKGNMSIHTIRMRDRYRKHELFRGSVILYLETCHPEKSPNSVPYQGAGTSSSCCTNRSQSLLDAFIRESRSCLSVDDCDDHACCEPLS